MSMATSRRRWGDDDRYFGPFTYAKDSHGYRPLALVLSSGDGDDHPGCSIRLSGFGHTLIAGLPSILKPWRQWVDTSRYDWSTSPAGGYWDIQQREFGFSLSDGFLIVYLGPQTGDSSTTKSWSKFLPWTQWRFIRHSLYGLAGEHVWTGAKGANFTELTSAKDRCATATFAFTDFDGEALTATTRIEEREWLFGEGWFRWLSFFRKPMVRRSLDIEFSGETGERKGSWKGGTIGHSIDMLPDELHEAAFRRYCAEHRMTFKGA